jgi:hypothetical protein
MMNSFVTATNSYAAALKRVAWKDVNVPEFKVFVAMLLYFGVVNLPSRRMAWKPNSIFRMPWAATVMTCKRFEAIMHSWHWMDSSHIAEAERKEKNKANPFWSVQGYLDAIAQNFREYYICPQCFDIDEQCIPWKGRHLAKCYNPNKPSKWHLKVYALNCSHTTYQCNFFMYQGRDEDRPAGMPATVFPVYVLLMDRFYWHQNYILYLDNWYTSMAVAVMLWVWGIYVVGTVRVNKKGIPKEAIFPKSGRGKRGRGEMLFSMTGVWCTSRHGWTPSQCTCCTPHSHISRRRSVRKRALTRRTSSPSHLSSRTTTSVCEVLMASIN